MADHYRNERAPNGSICFRIRLHTLLPFLPFGKKVLEIGCGNGLLTEELIARNNQVTALDYDEESIRSQQERKIPASFIWTDFLKFETPERFDWIICTEVLEHLADDASALRKMYVFLKKEGRLLLTVPIGRYRKKYLQSVGHLRHYYSEELKLKLKTFGFRVEQELRWGSFLRQLIIYTLPATPREKICLRVGKFGPHFWWVARADLALCPLKSELLLILTKEPKK